MRHLPTLLCAGCFSHAVDVTPLSPGPDPFQAWVWMGEPHETFLLTARRSTVAEFAALAAEGGHELRPATDDDFRQSWPALRITDVREPDGSLRVHCDLSAAHHVALVNLWVELMVVRETRRAALDPGPECFVQTALYSTRP